MVATRQTDATSLDMSRLNLITGTTHPVDLKDLSPAEWEWLLHEMASKLTIEFLRSLRTIPQLLEWRQGKRRVWITYEDEILSHISKNELYLPCATVKSLPDPAELELTRSGRSRTEISEKLLLLRRTGRGSESVGFQFHTLSVKYWFHSINGGELEVSWCRLENADLPALFESFEKWFERCSFGSDIIRSLTMAQRTTVTELEKRLSLAREASETLSRYAGQLGGLVT